MIQNRGDSLINVFANSGLLGFQIDEVPMVEGAPERKKEEKEKAKNLYYYSNGDGETIGPYTLAELRSLFTEQVIQSTTLIYHQDFDWTPAYKRNHLWSPQPPSLPTRQKHRNQPSSREPNKLLTIWRGLSTRDLILVGSVLFLVSLSWFVNYNFNGENSNGPQEPSVSEELESPSRSQKGARTWTIKHGSSFDADLAEIEGATVHLSRADNGKIETIKRDQLSPADVEFTNFKELRSRVLDDISRMERHTQYRSYRAAASELVRFYRQWIKAYDKDPNDAATAYKQLYRQAQDVFESKQIVAYKNILGSTTEVPVVFNLFKDSDIFYFKVGDGDISTVAPVSAKELLELSNALKKVQEWKEICRAEQMDTNKEVGRFGGISLEFVSREKGENVYVRMTAKGTLERDRLLREQKAWLSPLNISAMRFHIGRAQELYLAQEERQKNAEKLK